MAVTYSATPIASLVSIMSAALVSNTVGTAETVTLVHRLGVSPHRVWGYLRSIVAGPSLPPVACFRDWNASQATIVIQGGGPSAAYNSAATWDFVNDFIHSICQ